MMADLTEGLRKHPYPEQCPGAYSLDLYCDHLNPRHGFRGGVAQLVGDSARDCKKQARVMGWKLHKDRTATCPLCVAELKDTPQ